MESFHCGVLAQSPQGMWDPRSPTRDPTCILCTGRKILTYWIARDVPGSGSSEGLSPWLVGGCPLCVSSPAFSSVPLISELAGSLMHSCFKDKGLRFAHTSPLTGGPCSHLLLPFSSSFITYICQFLLLLILTKF